MAQVSTLFWDIGGVLLSNGWDRHARARAVHHFQLEHDDFDERHRAHVTDFEEGRLTLDAYLNAVIFYKDRPFSVDDFKHFMYAQSEPYAEMLDVARSLHASHQYLMAVLSNESRELTQYRIERFGLRSLFSLFLASCFLGIRKPDTDIYELALEITQTAPANALFIDDRKENVEAARSLGFQTIHHEDSALQLVEALKLKGITL